MKTAKVNRVCRVLGRARPVTETAMQAAPRQIVVWQDCKGCFYHSVSGGVHSRACPLRSKR